MAASNSTTVRITSASFFGAIRAMNNAVRTPIGKEINRDRKAIYSVFIMINPTLYKLDTKAFPSSQVVPVKKRHKFTRPTPSLSVTKGITPSAVTKTIMITMNEALIIVANKKNPLITKSMTSFFVCKCSFDCSFFNMLVTGTPPYIARKAPNV